MAKYVALQGKTGLRGQAEPVVPIWTKDEYERIDGGVRLVRVNALQGPQWLRNYRRWSLRIECCTMDEAGTVSAFVNLGTNPARPEPGGRRSKYYRWWCMANEAAPRKGEPMDWSLFIGKCFWADVSDSTEDENRASKQDFQIYSRITEFLRLAQS